jgi:hydrogenase maturation protease
MTMPKILVAGIGNIFHGDDAFGVEVAQRLTVRCMPDGGRVVNFGIRSYDLVFALLDGYDITILVDAVARGGEPGTLYLIEPDLNSLDDFESQPEPFDSHGMNPVLVLRLAKQMGAPLNRILLVGCEPETFGSENEGKVGLSPSVAQAVDEAVKRIESLIAETSRETNVTTALAM